MGTVCSDSNSVTEEVVADNELFYLNSQQVSVQRTMESAPTVLLYTCRELHLVKPTETRKRQITSLRQAPGWEIGPGSPPAHSAEVT